MMKVLRPGDGIGIHAGLRSRILGVRVSSGAPNRKVG